jgi:16S rRNA (guanine966-N2)-methyltransferase
MRTSIRIVAGSLRGRRLACEVNENLRPTPQMVREAFFSILGNAIPGRPFVDIFAGTGVVGIEALSRGASCVHLVERDPQLARSIEANLRTFNLARQAKLYRTDAYRWAAAWLAPKEPVNFFLSPPFADLTHKTDDLFGAIRQLQEKVADDSIIVVQAERGSPLDEAEFVQNWEVRRYGRNELLIWQRELSTPESAAPEILHEPNA